MNEERRICTRCNTEKPITAFSKQWITLASGERKAYHKPYCSGCQSKAYRKRKPDVAKAIAKRHKILYQSRQLTMKAELLKHIGQVGCKHCPETDIRCLTFHHRDPKTKEFKLSHGFTHCYSLEALKAEAEKCDALCANCHIKLHCNFTSPISLHEAVQNTEAQELEGACIYDAPTMLDTNIPNVS